MTSQSQPAAAPDLRSLEQNDAFLHRHIGPSEAQIAEMLAAVPAASLARMADCFGAPVLLVVGFDGALAPAAAYDVGSFVQTMCLAAHDRGLGTCQCATLTGYPGLLRDLLPGAHGTRLVVAVTLGWPDREAPINIYRRPRAPLEELVGWVS